MKPRTPLRKISKRRSAAGEVYSIKRSRVKRSNPARKKKEFARTYHSKERVEWIKAQDCWYLLNFNEFGCAGGIQNAHTVTGGMGRKADASTIIPLCAWHHARYDRHEPPFDDDGVRGLAILDADYYNRLWLASVDPGEKMIQRLTVGMHTERCERVVNADRMETCRNPAMRGWRDSASGKLVPWCEDCLKRNKIRKAYRLKGSEMSPRGRGSPKTGDGK